METEESCNATRSTTTTSRPTATTISYSSATTAAHSLNSVSSGIGTVSASSFANTESRNGNQVGSNDGGNGSGTIPQAPMIGDTPCIICIGMAGSGKTSVVQRINAYLHERYQRKIVDQTAMRASHATKDNDIDAKFHLAQRTPCYLLNLDPAVLQLPYEANVDIRETVNYKSVMTEYGLGPNGGIVTCLNLFATKFDQALSIMEKRNSTTDYFLFDTPGQIEVFTWSASGSIITETLASSFPTVIVYVVDTPRCTSPITFMSNMLYACSIMYKTRLPFILAFNKVDVTSHEFALEWMRDFESFRDEVTEETAYIGSMARSMGLVLEEFYQNFRTVGISAVTGSGMDDLFNKVDEAVLEYMSDFKPELDALLLQREKEKESKAAESLTKLTRDLKLGGEVVGDARPSAIFKDDHDEEFDSDDYDDIDDVTRAAESVGDK